MILTAQQLRDATPWGRGTFSDRVLTSHDWRSRTPPDFEQWTHKVLSNPAEVFAGHPQLQDAALVGGFVGDVLDLAASVLGQLQLDNTASTAQQVLGRAVMAGGMLSSTFSSMRRIFDQDASAYLRVNAALEVAGQVIESVLGFLGAVPVIGWVIDMALGFVKTILNMAETARAAGEAAAYRAIASSVMVPLDATEFTQARDEAFAKLMLDALDWNAAAYNPSALFLPMYGGAGDTWVANSVGYDDADSLRAGWIASGPALPGGFGVVPGSGDVCSGLFFASGQPGVRANQFNCYGVRDLGSLLPTGRGLAATQWSLVMQQGPMMFSLRPLQLRDPWADYARSLLELAKVTLSGFTWNPASVGQGSDQFYCVSALVPMGDCDKKNKADGRKVKIPTEGWCAGIHHLTLCGYVYDLFFGMHDLDDRLEKLPILGNEPLYRVGNMDWPEPDDLDYDQMVVASALDNLYERQHATLQSIQCMYVNGRDDEYGNRRRFPAFGDAALRKRWEESATALLSTNDWRRVTFVDMPEGDLKQAVRQKAISAGLDPNLMNAPCDPTAKFCTPSKIAMPGPTVLGDPPPPPPPPLREGRQAFGADDRADRPSTGQRKGQGGLILAAAVAAGFLMSRRG